ncbi:MAG: YARHG domain-containing protein [Bacteroidetes bacterium]|nr:YARHG domain-containing protein [Bacteroidota bacterium]MBP6316187.1 YARHG domain-containing protein [Chitinophagaceae bacterium]
MRLLFFICLFIFGKEAAAQMPKLLMSATNETYQKQQFSDGSILPGVYRFGESVGDLDVIVIPYGSKYIVQYVYAVWEKSYYTREIVKLHKYGTFNVVTADSNQLVFASFVAKFMNYQKNQKTVILYGDLVKRKPYGKDSALLGNYVSNVERYFADAELYELSLDIKSETYFKRKSSHHLELMRNTLYAKYGQVFRLGGELDEYFKKKEWYEPTLLETGQFLTDIERINLQLLEEEENRRIPVGRESDERE